MIEESILPDGWCWATLSDLGYWSGGGTPSKARKEFWTGGDIPWVSPKDMKTLLITDTEDHISTKALEETTLKLCSSGTILIVVRSGILQRILPVAVCQVPVTMKQDMKALSPINGVDAMYVAYYLLSSERNILSSCSKDGTTVASIESEALKAYPMPLSPTTEQHRIVTAIEQQFTRLDAAVTALQHAKTKLKRYRAAVLKAAVEGKLTEAWRAEHPATEPASALLERILVERRAKWEADLRAKGKDPAKVKYVEPAIPDGESSSELPEGWCWASLEQIAAPERNAITDGPFGSNLKTEHYRSTGVRVIRLQNIGDGVFKDEKAFIEPEHFEKLNKHRVFAGDLVIAALGDNPPRSCILPDYVGPSIVKADCIRFKVSQKIINTFANIAINSEPTRKRTSSHLHGVGRPRLNLSEIKSITIPLPPLLEQTQIVSQVERQWSILIQLEAAVEANLKRAERLRQSILKKAFAGGLVPQDPHDEPASMLLECIRKEREEQKRGSTSKQRTLKNISVPKVPDVEPVDIDANEMEQMGLWTSIGSRE